MNLIFKIITQKVISIDIPIDKMLEFPVHEHYMIEAHEKVVIYKFNPTENCDIGAYKDYLIKFLKGRYKAYSVVCGELQMQLKK